jgi:hypothetical protein
MKGTRMEFDREVRHTRATHLQQVNGEWVVFNYMSRRFVEGRHYPTLGSLVRAYARKRELERHRLRKADRGRLTGRGSFD